MKTVLVCIAKNEDNYIKEWVDYHLKLGFDNIFIYENNWRCNVDFQSDKVIKIPFDGNVKQLESYHNFIIHHTDKFDWAAFFDVDEFLVLKKHKSVNDFIEEFKNENYLAINWVFFGNNNHTKVENNNYSVLSRFTKRQIEPNIHIKSIFKLDKNHRFEYPHNLKNIPWSTTNGIKGKGPFNHSPDISVVQLNHYYSKTFEEYKEKVERGRADSSKSRLLSEYEHYSNFNEIDDYHALNFFNS